MMLLYATRASLALPVPCQKLQATAESCHVMRPAGHKTITSIMHFSSHGRRTDRVLQLPSIAPEHATLLWCCSHCSALFGTKGTPRGMLFTHNPTCLACNLVCTAPLLQVLVSSLLSDFLIADLQPVVLTLQLKRCLGASMLPVTCRTTSCTAPLRIFMMSLRRDCLSSAFSANFALFVL